MHGHSFREDGLSKRSDNLFKIITPDRLTRIRGGWSTRQWATRMIKGDHVRWYSWYVATLGDFNNAHTPHWHGNTDLVGGRRTDVLSVISAQMITADMVPDAPGIWIYHCHISVHKSMGCSRATARSTPARSACAPR